MKLADLEYPITQEALNYYKVKHKFAVMEVHVRSSLPNVLNMILGCLRDLKLKNCTEFAFNQINYKYHIMEDDHEWTVSLLGFTKLN